jgi:methylenetetrahydrofolate dehydrogenase (NADP+)/methenyltetrahydrofolate cyclohydrolase
MVLIQVGEDPASSFYVQSIINSGTKLGCECRLHTLAADTSEDVLLELIETAINDDSLNGIMIQKPLPRQISDSRLNLAVSPNKDLDCLHPTNLEDYDGTGRFFTLHSSRSLLLHAILRDRSPGEKSGCFGPQQRRRQALANMLLWKKAFANATCNRVPIVKPEPVHDNLTSRYPGHRYW